MARLTLGLSFFGYLLILLDFVQPFPSFIEDRYELTREIEIDISCNKCKQGVVCEKIPKGGCPFGNYTDSCENLHCYKGPGESCTIGLCNYDLACNSCVCVGCAKPINSTLYNCTDPDKTPSGSLCKPSNPRGRMQQ